MNMIYHPYINTRAITVMHFGTRSLPVQLVKCNYFRPIVRYQIAAVIDDAD